MTIRELSTTFENLISSMKKIYVRLSNENFISMRNKTVVIAIGSTGSGKSTLLSSLVHGPDVLELKKIEKSYTQNAE